MALVPGTRLGVYEVTSPIGEGGMGQVYRAMDTTLGRQVAIKVLSDAFAVDPERLARFEREAKTLASLNHPHIAAVYGFERSAGVHVLVMELVEGEDLSQRIARGAIPIDDALPIAKQIAEALEAAHEQGIIHRDLKPANIKVRPDGMVKVLDFGLAKAMEPAAGPSPSVSMSPTITTPAMTQVGMILGTAAYMSPEQARGKPLDKRADIWAFGCVFYEMLTGRRPFDGEALSDVLARIIEREPDFTALPVTTPPTIRRLLRRCLEKDRKERVPDIGVARLEIKEAINTPSTDAAPMTRITAPAPSLWRRVAFTGAPALVAGGVIVGVAVWLATRPALPRVTRLTITTSGTSALAMNGNDRDVAITPDGARVVYTGTNGTQLFVRALDTLEPVALASGGIRGPFVSPNGQWVGFFDSNFTLKKVAISGGPVSPIALLDGPSRGATWLPDDTIVVATSNGATGLQRVSATGGPPTVLTRPDRARGEIDHLWPEALPNGRAVLFTITAPGSVDRAQVAVLDLQTHAVTVLVPGGSDAHYVASGHLVYAAGGTLHAVPFDLGRLAVRGPAVPVVSRVATTAAGGADVGVGADGTLVYIDAPAGGAGNVRTLVWVDRAGREAPIAAVPPRVYVYPHVSPDDTRIAVSAGDREQDVWIWDLQRATLGRLTSEPGQDIDPIWTPDGRRIIFGSDRAGGQRNLWWQAADGTGSAERLTTSDNLQVPTGITPDGGTIAFTETTAATGADLMRVPVAGDRHPAALLATKFNEKNGAIAPNGRWLAYESDASGRVEVYVGPYPNVAAGQSLISTAGGTRPLWARSGKELFFLAPDGAVMRVSVEATGTTWSAGAPAKLFPGPYFFDAGSPQRTYDIAKDDQQFLMIKTAAGDQNAAPPNLVVIQHWFEELTRLVPTK